MVITLSESFFFSLIKKLFKKLFFYSLLSATIALETGGRALERTLDYLYACASNIEWINYCDSDSEDLLGADSISEISDEDEDNIDDVEADVENDVEMYDTEPETSHSK